MLAELRALRSALEMEWLVYINTHLFVICLCLCLCLFVVVVV